MTTIESTTDPGSLRSRLEGAVLAPGDDGWDAARQAYNLAVEQRPALIAFPEDVHDVVSVVDFARDRGLRVAAQRSGHNAGPLRSLEETVLVKTDAMQGVEIDAEARRARVRAGAKWENLVPLASSLGLAALHGSAPDVGIVGYSLGGGVGWYARKLGLATNSVKAIELVTADGELVRTDLEQEPELFWALRGGGGNFGVVTALEFELYPISEVYAGVLFFPWEQSVEVLHAWRESLPGYPDELTSTARLIQFPPLPELPEAMRGNSFAVVDAAYLGTEADGAELLRPLRELGPVIDTFEMVEPAALAGLHMDPPDPLPYVSHSRLLGDLPAQAIDDLVGVAGPGSDSPLAIVELRHTGGALARSAPHHGALATLGGSFMTFAAGVAFDEASTAANRAHARAVAEALSIYDAGISYANFVEEQVEADRFFPASTLRRLQAVKAQVDPGDLFQANHPIPPAR